MANRNQDWYNINSTRAYPLDDAATLLSDDGLLFPEDLFVDCHLVFPNTLGTIAFVSSAHFTDKIASLTFLASNAPAVVGCGGSLGPPPEFAPLASICIPVAKLERGRQYAVETYLDGVGGWVVFGDMVGKKSFVGRFSQVEQAMLSPRVCRAYEPLPVKSMAKLGNAKLLTDVVLLRAGTDIRITSDVRTIGGKERRAIIIALKNDETRNVLKDYIGPCGGRPETETCNKPAVETISGVRPNCEGNINIVFAGECVEVGIQSDGHGLVVDYCLGLDDACDKSKLPVGGDLPGTGLDQCEAEQPAESQSSQSFSSSMYQSSESCASLPYSENFEDGTAEHFEVKSGSFTFSGGAYVAASAATRNVAVWRNCAYHTCFNKRCVVKIELPQSGTEQNGGIVVDWKKGVRETYLVAEIHKPTDAFRLSYYNGNTLVVLTEAKPVGLQLGVEYTIDAWTGFSGGTPVLAASLKQGSNTIATIVTNATRLLTPGGLFGLQGYNAKPMFESFQLLPN